VNRFCCPDKTSRPDSFFKQFGRTGNMILIIIIVFFLITFFWKEMCLFASCIEELFSLYYQQREGRLCFFFFVLCFFVKFAQGRSFYWKIRAQGGGLCIINQELSDTLLYFVINPNSIWTLYSPFAKSIKSSSVPRYCFARKSVKAGSSFQSF
jgi:hypothetical protein